MSRLRPYPVAAFCAVTLFTWGNRIWLAWTNDEDTLGEKLAYSVPITAFVLAALVLSAALLSGADRTARWFAGLVRAFAAGTILYWAIRLPLIFANDHDVPFLVVHTVLAVGSSVAAALAWRSVRPGSPSAPAGSVGEDAALAR
jgi:hypothetical protein